MQTDEQVYDNPTGWVNTHIKGYVESGGKKGHLWQGITTLLLTARGRKTGKLRRTALIYGRDDASYLLVASNGGSLEHPAWYLNLAENPEVQIQVSAETFKATARTATAEEKQRLWPIMTKIFPQYETYQKKSPRNIPVVIVNPD